MEQLGSHWTNLLEIWHLVIFRKCVKKIQASLKSGKSNSYLTWRPIYVLIIWRSFLLRMRKILDSFVEKIKIHLFCSITFFFPEYHAVYEIMWKNSVEPDRPQMTIWSMRIACWIRNATNTHLQYNTYCFLHDSNCCMHASSLLRYTYVRRLFCYVLPHLSILSVTDLNNYMISFKHQRWLANSKQLSRTRH